MGLLPDWLPGAKSVSDPAACSSLADIWPGRPPASAGLSTASMISGGVRGLFVVQSDKLVTRLAADIAASDLDFLVVLATHGSELTQAADVVLPMQMLFESSGTCTNFARRLQHFVPAVAPAGESRAAWEIMSDLGARLGGPANMSSLREIQAEITQVVPGYSLLVDGTGMTMEATGGSGHLLPFSGWTVGRDVTYEGTVYANGLGEGAVWPTHGKRRKVAEWRPRQTEAPSGSVLVPSEVVYEATPPMLESPVIAPLVEAPFVEMSVFDGPKLGLDDGMDVCVAGELGRLTCKLRLRGNVTPGLVLAPLGLDWPTSPMQLLGGAPWAEVTVEQEQV
jgi:formate dehydrogenase major subunit